MPTYNFKTNGEITSDGALYVNVEGPAVISVKDDADLFILKHLDGSHLFYYPTNIFQIDGEVFEGTMAEFCDAADDLYASEATPGGGGYSNIEDDTEVAVSSTKTLDFVDEAGKVLLKISNGATSNKAQLGHEADEEGAIATATASKNSSGTASASLSTGYDAYTRGADVTVLSSITETNVFIDAYDETNAASFYVRPNEFEFDGVPLMLPRMNKAARNAFTPATGYMIYQTDNTPGLRVYNGTNWMKFTEATD